MTEWKLFEGDNPRASSFEFFAQHPWVPPDHQLGHAERTAMVAQLALEVAAEYRPTSISDLGCGDGSLLERLGTLGIPAWGYDAGVGNVNVAQAKGLDVCQANLLSDPVEYGELITCSEVVEHLERPHAYIAGLPGQLLILSSPSAETGDWHYYDHTWAWDLDGYAAMVRDAGWTIAVHRECDGDINHHNGVTRPQKFQAIFAMKD